MKDKVLILNKDRINRKMQRMAFQIWEHISHEKTVHFVGINGTGLTVANNLAARLQSISNIHVTVHKLSINKKRPLAEKAVLDAVLDKETVVLIDDVANSGKTLLYAMKPILAFEPKKIMVAVLVDRKHKSFPISPDIVGHSVATTLQDHIEVACEGSEIIGAYLQ